MSITEELQSHYEGVRASGARDLKSEEVSTKLFETGLYAAEILDKYTRQPLTTRIPNKSYFSFKMGAKLSRPVNGDLYSLERLRNNARIALFEDPKALPKEVLQKTLYTLVISFCALNDLFKKNDQKTPGTFFELFSSHLFAKFYAVNPVREVEVLNLDMEGNLPTDYIFDLGNNRSRIHLPVKTSTRERVIQVWAHQRVLDGIYGVDRFKGVLVCLAETNAQPGFKVTEVCLPKQWTIYQMYIAKLHRVYYLDLPMKYAELATKSPYIHVKQLADFFYEGDVIVDPSKG